MEERISPEALLANATWVRALALALTGDEHRADDIAQETWLAAQMRPPRRGVPLRPWLARVARNFSFKALRSEGRRARREAGAPPPIAPSTPPEILARAEVFQKVVAEVLALDEPYRTAVLMRYFEGRGTTEVAGLLGVPVETVRTRLKRALARLRERLDDEYEGGRRAWCALLLPLLREGTAGVAATVGAGAGTGITLGALLMSVKSVAAVTAAVLVVVVASILLTSNGTQEAPESAGRPSPPLTVEPGAEGDRGSPRAPETAGAPAVAPPAAPPGARLTVRVRDLSDRPVIGSRVTLHGSGGATGAGSGGQSGIVLDVPRTPPAEDTAETDERGEAVFADLATGTFTVRAVADGFAARTARVSIAEPVDPPPVLLVLPRAAELSGQVRDRDGKAHPDATVEASFPTWGGDRAFDRATAATDDAGRYRLTGLPPGRILLSVRLPTGVVVGAGMIEVPAVSTFDIVLDLSVTVRGRVIDDETGRPVPGARVSVLVSDLRRLRTASAAQVESRADGYYSLEGLPPGPLTLIEARKPGYMPFVRSIPPGTEPLEPGGVHEQAVRLRHGTTVRGRVVLATGEPVGDAEVKLRGRDWPRGAERRLVTRSAEDGTYRIAAVPPGEARIFLSASGCFQPGNDWGSWRWETLDENCRLVVPPEGEVVKDVTLRRGGVIEGVVTDGDGDPVEGALVNARPGGGVTVVTDAEGAFRLEGIHPFDEGRVHARGYRGEAGVSEPFALSGGEPATGILVTLRPGVVLAGFVRAEGGETPRGADLRLAFGSLSARQSAHWEYSRMSARPIPVASDGSFRLTGLRPGKYTLLCGAPGFGEVVGPRLRLEPGERREDIEIVLPSGRSIRGRVVLAGGGAAAGVPIHVLPWPERAETLVQTSIGPVRALTDDDGRFEVRGLAEGEYRITAELPGMVDNTKHVSAGADDVVITLRPGLRIAGVVVDKETGSPVAGVPISADPSFRDPRRPHRYLKTRSGPDGAFVLAPLWSGSYRLFFSGRRDSRDEGPDHVGKALEVDAGTDDLRVELQRGLPIAGQVVDEEGRPVSKIRVSLTFRGPVGGRDPTVRGGAGGGVHDVLSDSFGAFEARGLPPGAYDLRLTDTGSRGFVETWIRGVKAGTEGLVVVMSRGRTISGRVVGPDGGPPSGEGRVSVTPSGNLADRSLPLVRVRVDGTFITPALDPKREWDLRATGFPGTLGGEVTGVAAGAEGVVITLVRGGSISGRVVDVSGDPVPAGIYVAAYPKGPGRDPRAMGRHPTTRTREGGYFELTGLGDCEFRVLAGGAGQPYAYVSSEGADAARPGATDVVIRVRRCVTISGRLVDDEGNGVRGYVSYRQTFPGGMIASGVRTDLEGNFVIDSLSPGRVSLTAELGSRRVDLGEFMAPAEGLMIPVPRR